MRILRIKHDVDGAGAIIEIKNFFPGLAAIARAENAALRVGAVSVAESRNKNDVGIRGMNDQRTDVTRVFEADVGPRLAAVGGFVDAVAKRNVAADAGFAGADVNDVGIGIGNVDGADRGNRLLVKK